MSIHTFFITLMFLTSLLATASALHYKNTLDALRVKQHHTDKRTITLATNLNHIARDIRIATYPTECDALTKKIIGEECDLGNYMEWAAPHLERETERLLLQVKKQTTMPK